MIKNRLNKTLKITFISILIGLLIFSIKTISDLNKDFDWKISNCESSFTPEDSYFEINIINNRIFFEEKRYTNCGFESGGSLNLIIEENLIKILENNTVFALCNCNFKINGYISNIEVGNYNLSVYHFNHTSKSFELKYTHLISI